MAREKFAQGVQAELFNAHIKWRDPRFNDGTEYALKVFNKGTFYYMAPIYLAHPRRGNGFRDFKIPSAWKLLFWYFVCGVVGGWQICIPNGKQHEDLRSLIDRRVLVQGDNGHGHLQKKRLKRLCTALLVGWIQHTLNIKIS